MPGSRSLSPPWARPVREAEGAVADGSARGGGITAVATGSAEARAIVDMPSVNGSASPSANGSKAIGKSLGHLAIANSPITRKRAPGPMQGAPHYSHYTTKMSLAGLH